MTFHRTAISLIFVALAGLTGCSSHADPWDKKGGPPRVVVSVPALYSFVKQVGGDRVGVICLCTETGPHEYEFNPKDEIAVKKADRLFGIGLGLDGRTETGKDEKFMDKLQVSSGLDAKKYVKLGSRLKTPIKKLEGDDDPHVWLGIEPAKEMVNIIADELSEVDAAGKDIYHANAKKYCEKLDAFQKEYRNKLKDKKERMILPMHDALQYFNDSFGLEIQEAIELKPGDKPDAQRYKELVEKCKKDKIRVLAREPQYTAKEAETLMTELKSKGIEAVVIEIDPLETAGSATLDADWYLNKMRENLEELVKTLK